MGSSKQFLVIISIFFLIIAPTVVVDGSDSSTPPPQCRRANGGGQCHDKVKSLKLKIIAISAILLTSLIGICLPLLSRGVSALQPNTSMFVLVKAFASGVILATGYMHVMPDSFDCLRSECLPENPWRPFTTFVAMLSAVLTLMVDSFAMSTYYRKFELKSTGGGGGSMSSEHHRVTVEQVEEEKNLGHFHLQGSGGDDKESQLLRYRVVAQVLELGIVVHSVVIGLSMGASNNPCTIKPLVAALCFHQMFEGMGLGGCILQAEYGVKMKAIMVFFFSCTTPFGITLGIGLSNVYSENSPTALIVVGLLNACSAGLLNYMALVDLLAADFMGPKLQKNMKLQAQAYVAVLLGAGGMSLMAKWA